MKKVSGMFVPSSWGTFYTLTLSPPPQYLSMEQPNVKFLGTLLGEAYACFNRGDMENGKAILYSFFDRMHPELIEDARKDKKLIYDLIKEKNQKDPMHSFVARAMLNYLKDKGGIDI